MATKKKTVKKAAAAVETPQVEVVEPVEIQKMDPKVKKLWVADLRSGNYKQVTGTLREIYLKNRANGVKAGDVKGMCCLGVLTDRFVRSKSNVDKIKWEQEKDDKWDEKEGDYVEVPTSTSQWDGETSLTPDQVQTWAGLFNADPEVPLGPLFANKKYKKKLDARGIAGDITTLAALNDGGFTFAEIADIIEEYL